MTPEPLLVDVNTAATMLSISRSLLYELLSSGQFPSPLKISNKTLFRVTDLRKYVDTGGKWGQE